MSGAVIIPGHIPPSRAPHHNAKREHTSPHSDRLTNAQKQARHKQIKRSLRLQHLAVLDLETDPFIEDNSTTPIFPFCAELYSDQFGSQVFWNDDPEQLMERVCHAIEMLPDVYTIYAHNGGKFDFMFLVSRLRGIVRYKGRAIMCAKIGNHELRDSLHILPEKLAAWKKDTFDYSKMLKRNRHKFREEILAYLHSDCVYLFDFIRRFTQEFGLKISIGQAAFTALKQHYKVAQIKEYTRVSQGPKGNKPWDKVFPAGTVLPGDTYLRRYFYGGRVECIAGMGLFESKRYPDPYVMLDTNSMYPFVMATREHPIGGDYVWRSGSNIGKDTVFLDVICRSNGALFQREETGEKHTNAIYSNEPQKFFTTIWEFSTALRLGWIKDVEVIGHVDNAERTNFAKFIVPMYDRRQQTKIDMKAASGETYEELKKEGIFLKYLLTNSYGKTAQNPSKYKEFYYVDHDQLPPDEWFAFLEEIKDRQRAGSATQADIDILHMASMPWQRSPLFDVWRRPNPGHRYNNVGTGASITGAARAVLMAAYHNADDPIYCDTDSLICRRLSNHDLHDTRLGAWKLEETFDAVIITGRKTYCGMIAGKDDCDRERLKVRSKGVDLRIYPRDRYGLRWQEAGADEWRAANVATWQRYSDMLAGHVITTQNPAPTFSKLGEQNYMRRQVRATAPIREGLHHVQSDARTVQSRE